MKPYYEFLECHVICFRLKQESQIVLLLNETATTSESSGDACMLILQANDLPFVSIPRSTSLNFWNLHQLKVIIISATSIPLSFTSLISQQSQTSSCVNFFLLVLLLFLSFFLVYIFSQIGTHRTMLFAYNWRMRRFAAYLTP